MKTNSGVPLAGNTPTSNVFNGNNQIGGGSYDAAGNQTGVNGDTAAYDAESRQSSLTEPASLGSGVENYLYDGNGQRVEKTGPDGATIYVYDAAGRVAAEYGTSGLASPCTTCYMVTDNLGTARLVTDAGANVIARHDYLPFGEEIAGGTAGRSSVWGAEADTISRKFTGKERDQESGLDYFGARYYGSALGRWVSPDSVNLTDDRLMSPSSTINKYIYGGDNPLKYVDPDGRDITIFYEQGRPLPGHTMLLAYNQDTGATAVRSFGPNHDYTTKLMTALPLSPVSGTDGFDLSNLKSADGLRSKYSTITIQTSPEVAQQVIDEILSHPDGNYTTYWNNCTTTCSKVLRDMGLLDSHALIPEGFFNDLYFQYGNGKKNESFWQGFWGYEPYKAGQDYGHPRPLYDPFQLFFLTVKSCHSETATWTQNGKVTGSTTQYYCSD